ncbi:MAG: CO dehydrogenase/CO-methylating acetyl-CoA synthase complex subunit beta [Deltaproteobacteria bacterium]|nr:CO dehydrogenase/CO-methylating acetyl-CoA synthase complex subunit beta [Deltaproteobacteria bacterium]
MSKLIASLAIQGAHNIVSKAEEKYRNALEIYGGSQILEFPNTAYYLPVIYSLTGLKVKDLDTAKEALQLAQKLLPPHVREGCHLPFLGPMLDAGMAAVFAEEIVEAIRYVEEPDLYQAETEDPDIEKGRIWLGAADDAIMRKRGVEFVDGTAPGFVVIAGSAPDSQTARKIAEDYQQKSVYVFMTANHGSVTLAEQLIEEGVQIGWNTRLIPFGPGISQAVFALGFANRVAMSFGGIQPGDYRKILDYEKDRVFAFINALGDVNAEWAANAAGALNWGFPTIAEADIPEILPYGVCTYEHVVSNISLDQISQKSIEVRGLKVNVSSIDIPLAYGPAFEGERVRKDDIFLEMGGGRTHCVELVKIAEVNEIKDGQVNIIGPDIKDISKGSLLPLGIYVQVAGRQMQPDFEPILERQIHHLINYAQGIMHIGQRDIAWIRVSQQAVARGFTLKDIGKIIYAKFHQDFSNIVDKVEVTLYTEEEDVNKLIDNAKAEYRIRDERVENMTDENEAVFYSCTLCQSFAPNHVCIISPERTGLCGAYNWMDCKASFEINPTGPNQPVEKGECLEPFLGQWKGINAFIFKASRQALDHYNLYSVMNDPMTTCGCCECICAVLPGCNGVMTVNREYSGETPSGMKFTALAGFIGGGQSVPGFVGHSKYNITQRKFISGDGGLLRVVWMPKSLKEEIRERLIIRGQAIGVPDLIDMIADETTGVTEEDILMFLEEKGHPALNMDPIL